MRIFTVVTRDYRKDSRGQLSLRDVSIDESFATREAATGYLHRFRDKLLTEDTVSWKLKDESYDSFIVDCENCRYVVYIHVHTFNNVWE